MSLMKIISCILGVACEALYQPIDGFSANFSF